jgi:hypothetical protein
LTTNKYEITNIKYQHFEFTLYRIRALKNFGDVKADQLGGFVQGYHNLSQETPAGFMITRFAICRLQLKMRQKQKDHAGYGIEPF